MELCQPDLGGETLEAVVIVGSSMPIGTDKEGGKNYQETSLGYSQCHHIEGDKRRCGKHQQPDQNGSKYVAEDFAIKPVTRMLFISILVVWISIQRGSSDRVYPLYLMKTHFNRGEIPFGFIQLR